MTDFMPSQYEGGSLWRRWNPHIHAPRTMLNDQFKSDWEGYLRAIEDATPTVEALGVTDYFCIECYKAVKTFHDKGRLPNLKLLFPNVEFRLSVETAKQKGINLHLLFSPEDDDHIAKIEQALSMLVFEYKGNQHRCVWDDFIRLGRTHNPELKDDFAACCEGVNQFKIDLAKLQALFRGNKWVVDNCIVAVSASNNDGTAGLKDDASFAALRQEIERFAHVIFSSNPNTREFWLAKSPSTNLTVLEKKFGGRKPCLHGCDAHEIAKVCQPDQGRLCWIKGDPTFASLRQALLEPEERIWIGPTAPDRHDASQCIVNVLAKNAPWIAKSSIPINSGLVAIIGARGSGKTALADLLAFGSDVHSPLDLQTSFIHRASHPINHLEGSEVHISWGDGTIVPRWMNQRSGDGIELVRYLSQQFVEQLCSSAGLATGLRREIERVIFDATDPSDRLTAESFEQLANIRLQPILRQRENARMQIKEISNQITVEEALHNRIPTIEREREERRKGIEKTTNEMKTLVPKGKEERAKRLADLENALNEANAKIEKLRRAKLRVFDLRKQAANIRSTTFPNHLTSLKNEFADAGLTEEQWKAFEMKFSGDVEAILDLRDATITEQVGEQIDGISGKVIDLSRNIYGEWPQKVILAERDKIKKEVGIDGQKQLRYSILQMQINNDQKAQLKSATDLELAKGAAERKKQLIAKRKNLYAEIVQTYVDEQAILELIYGPLQKTLEGASGSLSRLRLVVTREIDLGMWVRAGEELLDLRMESRLRGRGALESHVKRLLLWPWCNGTSEQVGQAMQQFITELYAEIRKSMPSDIGVEGRAAWEQRVAAWLYSTDHIRLRYGITYDNVEIELLSAGTRGIVLLLLYLVIDQQDRRPLIIDQPEESLDPKSVYDELVPHFREARKRRQVIIVTHNANLVVNTDADQVIVASAEPNPAGRLPSVTYRCGSLENQAIRKAVCEILEGGERAFQDRQKRYRLQRENGVET